MADKLPVSIENFFPSTFPCESWNKYVSDNGKEIYLYIRRNNEGMCQWGVYVNDAHGTRKPVKVSSLCKNAIEADVQWFQSRIKLE